jgi:hypothetical protein
MICGNGQRRFSMSIPAARKYIVLCSALALIAITGCTIPSFNIPGQPATGSQGQPTTAAVVLPAPATSKATVAVVSAPPAAATATSTLVAPSPTTAAAAVIAAVTPTATVQISPPAGSTALAPAKVKPVVKTTPTVAVQPTNVITNGNFETPFLLGRGIALGWNEYNNGNSHFGYYDETWNRAIFEGNHAQMIEIRDTVLRDRIAGLYQTVNVVPGASYVLTIHGLVRSDEGGIKASNYGYRLYYGIDYDGGTNFQNISKWNELQWDDQPRKLLKDTDTYTWGTYTTTVTATGSNLTFFIHGMKKWNDFNEGNFDIDGISLVGVPASVPAAATATSGQLPTTGNPAEAGNNLIPIIGGVLLLALLLGGAISAVMKRRA